MSTRIILIPTISVLFFFVILHQTLAQLGCNTNLLNTRQNLNISRFMGTWYRLQYATFNLTSPPSLQKCASTFYDYQPGSTTDLRGIALYKYVATNEWEADFGNITVPDPSLPAVWNAYWEIFYHEEVEMAVVSTDYENWAFTYACQIRGGVAHQIMNTWSRTPTMAPSLLAFIQSLLWGLGWLFSKTIVIDHQSCD